MAELTGGNVPKVQLEPFVSNIIAILLAIVLSLVLGYFGILGVILAGVIVGFLVRNPGNGAKYSFIGGFIGTTIFTIVAVYMGIGLVGIPPEYLPLISALLLIIAPIVGIVEGIIVAIGGYLGGLIAVNIYANR